MTKRRAGRTRTSQRALPITVAAVGLATLGVVQALPNRNAVQSQLTDRSTRALSAAGLTDARVQFDGRDATVRVRTAGDRDRALAIVRSQQGVRVAHVIVDRAAPGAGDAPSGRPSKHPSAPIPSTSATPPDRSPIGPPSDNPGLGRHALSHPVRQPSAKQPHEQPGSEQPGSKRHGAERQRGRNDRFGDATGCERRGCCPSPTRARCMRSHSLLERECGADADRPQGDREGCRDPPRRHLRRRGNPWIHRRGRIGVGESGTQPCSRPHRL